MPLKCNADVVRSHTDIFGGREAVLRRSPLLRVIEIVPLTITQCKLAWEQPKWQRKGFWQAASVTQDVIGGAREWMKPYRSFSLTSF